MMWATNTCSDYSIAGSYMKYKLNQHQKASISNNLIAFMDSREELSQESAAFIGNWILTDASEKGKSYYDTWDMVLKSYMPFTRPVLYRSCNRRDDGKIASFTESIRSAYKFSGNKGFLLICDTEETLSFPGLQKCGDYRHTFFPISELLKKEAQSLSCKFSKSLIENYAKEGEYIMRVNLGWMYSCKWCHE